MPSSALRAQGKRNELILGVDTLVLPILLRLVHLTSKTFSNSSAEIKGGGGPLDRKVLQKRKQGLL